MFIRIYSINGKPTRHATKNEQLGWEIVHDFYKGNNTGLSLFMDGIYHDTDAEYKKGRCRADFRIKRKLGEYEIVFNAS
jgi:hypothetical protein